MRIQGKRIWIGGQFVAAQLEIEKGTIERIYNYGMGFVDHDYGDKRILSGFIDIYIHGAYDFDTNDGGPEGLRSWMKRIPEEGVTSTLPATVIQMPGVLIKVVANVAAVVEGGHEGVEILGIHFEGPFLDMEHKGVQPPEATAAAFVEQFKRYQAAARRLIKYITLAPERDPDHTLTGYCSTYGVMVSMGHFAVIYEQALLGIVNDATSMTHVYNGMTPYHHRKPGLVGIALRVRDIYGEIICDGCYSHLAAFNNFFHFKGRDYPIMISDPLRAKHCPPGGQYQLGGHDIEIGGDGLARLKGSDTIAGSTLNMNRGLRILMEEAMIPFDIAVNSCITSSARCLGVGKQKGRIAAGHDGGLVVLGDDYSVTQTQCRGCVMF